MKNEIWSRIGDPSQIVGIKHYESRSGRTEGTEVLDTRISAGLAFTVVKDRVLDAVWASYKDTVLSFITPNGTVAPVFFESQGSGFLRSFYAGLLTTCGFSYIGTPCEDDGETLGLHGHLVATPAEEVGHRIEWTDDSTEFAINGKVREIRLFGENLTLERITRCRYSENVIRIKDKMINHGSTRQLLQILYHFNCGWPLLLPRVEVLLSVKSVTPRTLHATEGLASHLKICTPQPGFDEQVYYLALNSDNQGMSKVALVSAELGWGIYEKSDIMQLPSFTQWKNLSAGEYVMRLKVSNSFLDGCDKERAQGRLPSIEPGETKKYYSELGIVDGDVEISVLKAEITGYRQSTAIKAPGSISRPGVDYALC